MLSVKVITVLLTAFVSLLAHSPSLYALGEKSVDSLHQRIQKLEQENRDFRTKLEYIDKLYDKRFDDFTKWLTIILTVMGVGTAIGVSLSIISANNVARKQAIEELYRFDCKMNVSIVK
ncbi:MAG: hypothetical protein EAZ92_11895 [Candidatus Kapaibacterium sp.]|nr:MAG: hypothetical protein EAZ92_11895 [Candidatus Kapabacteria bacterium]